MFLRTGRGKWPILGDLVLFIMISAFFYSQDIIICTRNRDLTSRLLRDRVTGSSAGPCTQAENTILYCSKYNVLYAFMEQPLAGGGTAARAA